MTERMRLHSELGLLVGDVLDGPAGTSPAPVDRLRRGVRRWWTQQRALQLEDEVLGPATGLAPLRLVLPLVSPVLLVPAVLLLREPGNVVAFVSLVFGAAAIAYGALAESVGRRLEHPFWLQLVTSVFYAALISAILWIFLSVDHPRAHAHWIVFFLYFLLIGAMGLSDDPRHWVFSGAFSIIGYLVVVHLVHEAALTGRAAMAVRLAPEFEWVANSSKVALLAAATVMASASAARARALRRMSLRDGLTGLLNRHFFDQCLERVARRAERKRRGMTIAMIDIDHFKRLNDTHGHATGDDVLRWMASRLQRGFRSTDVVARYGGEEFVVAFLDTDDEHIGRRLEFLRRGIEATTLQPLDSDADIQLTVSIGVARFPRDGERVSEVLARADERLYQAKESGRNRIVAV